DDVVAGFYQPHRCIDRRHAGSEGISERCTFQGRQVAFQRQTRRVTRASVFKALVAAQALLSVGRSLINRNGNRAGRRVRFLTGMNCSSSKTQKRTREALNLRMQKVGVRRTDSSVCMILVSIQEGLLTFRRGAEVLFNQV